MGVDWYPCEHCGETFPDCGSYVYCNDDCYKRWCSDECAEADGFVEDRENIDRWGDSTKSCKFCRKEDADDSVLLAFLLIKCGYSRADVVAQFYKEIS